VSYLAELDDYPQEVRQGFAANVLRFWPKVLGTGNVAADFVPLPSAVVYGPKGEALGAAAVLPQQVGNPLVSRFDITINASAVASWPLGSNYRADVSWSFGAEARVDSLRFDVVRVPFLPHISLNDFLEEIADAGEYLEGQAEAILDGRTPEQHASILGVKAWGDVRRKLEAKLKTADGERVYARLIVDPTVLRRITIAQSIYRMFRAEGESEPNVAGGRLQEWKDEVELRMAELGELDYDADDDGVADEVLRPPVERQLLRRWPGRRGQNPDTSGGSW